VRAPTWSETTTAAAAAAIGCGQLAGGPEDAARGRALVVGALRARGSKNTDSQGESQGVYIINI
jgi:hypothetical protein